MSSKRSELLSLFQASFSHTTKWIEKSHFSEIWSGVWSTCGRRVFRQIGLAYSHIHCLRNDVLHFLATGYPHPGSNCVGSQGPLNLTEATCLRKMPSLILDHLLPLTWQRTGWTQVGGRVLRHSVNSLQNFTIMYFRVNHLHKLSDIPEQLRRCWIIPCWTRFTGKTYIGFKERC